MSTEESKVSERLSEILAGHQSGRSLPGEVYRDPQIYEREIRGIFMKSWLYVGHQSQIPEAGSTRC
jgi:hypothetical protein